MPYDETLARRVRPLLAGQRGLEEKTMFGGVGFLLDGNMSVGVWREFLIVRTGLDAYEAALNRPHVRKFDVTGRVMRGWVMVQPGGVESDEELQQWVQLGVEFARALPPK